MTEFASGMIDKVKQRPVSWSAGGLGGTALLAAALNYGLGLVREVQDLQTRLTALEKFVVYHHGEIPPAIQAQAQEEKP